MNCKCNGLLPLVNRVPSRCGHIDVYRCALCRETYVIDIVHDDYDFDDEDDMSVFECLDCGVDTAEIDEYYMVHNSIWYDANPNIEGMLCIECLERRIGRELNPYDFTDAAINWPYRASERKLNRLGYV
jgi:hypothetical protein